METSDAQSAGVASAEIPGHRIALLSDEPAERDDFAGQAHDSVASSIAEIVSGEDGGKVIGLEGSWGSGKSTVVRLLTNRLTTKNDASTSTVETHVVVFDAWSHQGDPLRRTFLENLIHELSAAGWLGAREARAHIDELTGQVSKVETESTPSLSFEGKVTAASAALVPLGLALFEHDFRRSIDRTIHILGLAGLFAPILVVLAFTMLHLLGKSLGGRQRVEGDWRRRLADLEPTRLLLRSENRTTRTEGIEHGQPTSVEFEKAFGEVLSHSLTPARRLLLVLDNLDRVDETDARTILATMQTFTRTGGSPAPWKSRLWTLIPYDPQGLDRLWAAAGDPGVVDSEGKPVISPAVSAFIDKVFQIRFETPPLVLSDWRKFLFGLLTMAFGEGDPQYEKVVRLRALYRAATPQHDHASADDPTPRQLKQWINQIGGLARQHPTMDLVHAAYYALLRHDGINVTQGLQNASLPAPSLAYLMGSGVKDDLAALHFGTSPAIAQQLLLGQDLQTALTGGDRDAIDTISGRAGFLDVLDGLSIEPWAEGGGIELTRAFALLDDAGVLELDGATSWLTGAVLPIVRSTTSWTLSGRESGAGLAVLIGRAAAGDAVEAKRLLERVAPKPPEGDPEGELQLAGAAGLADGLYGHGYTDPTISISLDIPDGRLVAALADFGRQIQDSRSRGILSIARATPAALAQVLAAQIPAQKLEDLVRMMEVLLARPDQVELTILASGLLEPLSEVDPPTPDAALTALTAVDRIRRATDINTVIRSAADNGTLANVVAIAESNRWSREAALASILHLRVRPILDDPAVLRSSASGMEIIRRVLVEPTGELVDAQTDWCRAHKSEVFEFITSLARSRGTHTVQPWINHVVGALNETEDLVISAQQYRQEWQWIRTMVGEEDFLARGRRLFASSRSRGTLTKSNTDAEFAKVAISLLDKDTQDDFVQDIRIWTAEIISALSKDDWEAALGAPETDPRLTVALWLAGSAAVPTDLTSLADALHTHFASVAEGQAVWTPDAATFTELTSLLTSAQRQVLASELCAELEGRASGLDAAVVTTYGGFLGNEQSFREHQKLPNVIERLVANDQWDEVGWIVDLARQHPDTLHPKGREAEIAYLRERVDAKLREVGDECPPELSGLASLLSDSGSSD